jgi:hypothetical protein
MKRKKPKLDAEFWRRDAENRRRMAERVAEIEAELAAEKAQPATKDAERRAS